jgi:hypothetical protein
MLSEFGNESILPVVVDLPESTWPMTTMLMWVFSSLLSRVKKSISEDRSGDLWEELCNKKLVTYPMATDVC